MIPHYKQIASIQINDEIGMKISTHGIDRDLTKEEDKMCSTFLRNFIALIQTNDKKSSSEEIENMRLEKEELLSLFPSLIHVKEIENLYWPGNFGNSHRPWFRITTSVGVIIIGWRKQVISIDWSESDITSEANTLFPNEDATKTNRLIHAWGTIKQKNTLMYF